MKVETTDDSIVITLSFENMKSAFLGLQAIDNWSDLYQVEPGKEKEFAKAVVNYLESESENGTTPLHTVFDDAFLHAIESGEGIEISESEFENLFGHKND